MECTYASVMCVGSFFAETRHPKETSIYLPPTQRS